MMNQDIYSPEIARPDIEDLKDYTEAGIVKRGLTRYFFPKNYKRSIKMHSMLGTPLVRKAVMNTVGRNHNGYNYRLNPRMSRLDAAMDFATRGSIFNETVHTVFNIPAMTITVYDAMQGDFGPGFIGNAVASAFNLSLVALQRYNRARMLNRVDEELASGATFSPHYQNKFGLDASALRNYYDANEVALSVTHIDPSTNYDYQRLTFQHALQNG